MDSVKFPSIVYRSPGKHFGPTVKDPETGEKRGTTYASVGVKDEDELAQRLKQGWHLTLPAAIGVKDEGAAASPPVKVIASPARKALEKQAAELGVPVDGRWGDDRLKKAIDDALAKPKQ